MHFYPTERIALFIDGANLYATAKALGFDIDYKRLLALFRTKGLLVRAQYYTALAEDQEYSSIRPLVDWLDYNGYTMVTKPTKEFTDSFGRRKIKGNMDIELAVDAMKLGAIDFIRKPMTPDTVRGAVAAALARRAPKALPAPPRAAPEIVALTMNGFQIVRVPGDKDSAEHRFKVQRFADRSEHEVAVAVEPEAVSRVARLSRKNLPAGGSFWKLQAERTLARHLWNEGQLPEGGRLTLSDISRDDLDVAAIWEGD